MPLSSGCAGVALDRLTYTDAAAAGDEQAMARISRHFVPFMLDAGHLAAGHRLLDVATGTGLQAVREDIRQSVGDTGGPVDIDVQYRFASGRR